jgi:hypothetical protein
MSCYSGVMPLKRARLLTLWPKGHVSYFPGSFETLAAALKNK